MVKPAFLCLKKPVLIRSSKQQLLHQHLLEHHKGGATVEGVRVNLAALDYPIDNLRLNTQIHDHIWRLWEMGFVRSKSEHPDRRKPGLTYWIPTYGDNMPATTRKKRSTRSTRTARRNQPIGATSEAQGILPTALGSSSPNA